MLEYTTSKSKEALSDEYIAQLQQMKEAVTDAEALAAAKPSSSSITRSVSTSSVVRRSDRPTKKPERYGNVSLGRDCGNSIALVCDGRRHDERGNEGRGDRHQRCNVPSGRTSSNPQVRSGELERSTLDFLQDAALTDLPKHFTWSTIGLRQSRSCRAAGQGEPPDDPQGIAEVASRLERGAAQAAISR